MIRDFTFADLDRVREIHAANGLPGNCFPELVTKNDKDEEVIDPLFLVNAVVEQEGTTVMASFLKGISEVYVLVDHSQGTPEQRWQWLQELTAHMKREAWLKGLDSMTCWVPPEIEKSFADRLKDLGFIRSPWQSYTLPLY
jgi:hypothetical protein